MIGPWTWLPLLGAVGTVEAVPVTFSPLTLGIAIALLGGSAFFSGSETALFSLQPVDRQAMPEPGKSRVERLLQKPRRTLATLLIGNELANVTLSAVTAGLLLAIAPDKPWLNLVVLTPVLLLLGEVLPKVIAMRSNRRMASVVALPLASFSVLVTPVRWLLTQLAEVALVLTGGTTATKKAQVREAQLRNLIDQGGEAGSLKPLEQEMLHKVFDFGELTVNRLMTPRPDVFSVSLTTPWPELLNRIQEAGFSRVPVYRADTEDVIGILVVKSLLPLLERSQQDPDYRLAPRELKDLLLPAQFVPTTKRADDLLREFRTERLHLAIVVDEHGSIAGVVTLDDLLAELVGELLDEGDIEDPDVSAIGPDQYTVRGGMDVKDFEERFAVELPTGQYTTLGGFILDTVGGVPEKGDEIDVVGLRFVVSGIEGRRVTEVSIRPIAPPSPGHGEAR
jgi:putative hemolysin